MHATPQLQAHGLQQQSKVRYQCQQQYTTAAGVHPQVQAASSRSSRGSRGCRSSRGSRGSRGSGGCRSSLASSSPAAGTGSHLVDVAPPVPALTAARDERLAIILSQVLGIARLLHKQGQNLQETNAMVGRVARKDACTRGGTALPVSTAEQGLM
jgi:hypothetical protein